MGVTHVEADAGAGGAKLATDEIATINYPIGKIDNGAAGVAGGPVTAGNPLPVVLETGADSIGKLAANSGVDIGDVDILSSALPTGASTSAKQLANDHDVTVTTMPASDVETDTIGVGLMTDVIMNDITKLTPKFAVISAVTDPNNTLVAAVGAKKIRIMSMVLVAAGAVDIRLEDGAGGSAISGVMSLTTNSGFTLPFSPIGWGETTANTLLNLELSAAVQVSGMMTYLEV